MQNNSRRISLILGGFMALVLIAGVILPLFQTNTTTTPADIPDPTDIPTPTFPPPVTDFSAISLDQVYLHPTGLYTIAQPTGWTVTSPATQAGIAQVGMNNAQNLSVIDAYVQKPSTPVSTLDDVSALLTRDALAQTWTRYNNWTETNRRIENERLLIDFAITFSRTQYVARQVSWTDGTYIYSVRVVVPANGTELLRYLIEALPPTLQLNSEFAFAPFEWQSYYDNVTNVIVRYPQTWTVQDSAPGRTASILSPDGAALRLDFQPLTAALDEATARAYVQALQGNATITSVVPVTRDALGGFAITYSYSNADGEQFSGQSVLLDNAGTLSAANLRFAGADVDLNNLPPAPIVTPEPTPSEPVATLPADVTPTIAPTVAPDPTAAYREYAQVMETFRIVAPINLNPLNLPPTSTPLPTLAVTATPVASATPEPSATSIPPTTTDVPPSATPRPTATDAPPTATTAPATSTPRPSATPRATATASS